MTYLEIIDTAVKIGLGALISGASTYLVAKHNHQRELKKLSFQRRLDSLEKASELAEKFINAWLSAASTLGGIYNGRHAPEADFSERQWERIKGKDKSLLEAREAQYLVVAKLRLIGATSAADKLNDLHKVISKFRDPLILQRETPSKEEFFEARKEVRSLIDAFHLEMSNLYCSLLPP